MVRQLLKVSPPLVLLEVLLPGEARARAPVAIGERTEERLLGRQVHLVHFPLVPQEPARVGESGVEFAAGLTALVWSLVSVHVLVPFTDALERLVPATTVDVVAEHLALFVARRGSGAPKRPLDLDGWFRQRGDHLLGHDDNVRFLLVRRDGGYRC
ncbi:hypothetical protein PHISCL_10550, partial [Aspergillus sclerotialis]